MKIHECQMSIDQKESIRSRLTELFRKFKFEVLPHALRAMREDGVRWADTAKAIAYGNVIEFKVENTVRVVVRYPVNGRDVCVVVDLSRHAVVTVWCNDCDDNHYTLDLSQYQEFDVHQYLRGV